MCCSVMAKFREAANKAKTVLSANLETGAVVGLCVGVAGVLGYDLS